MEPSISGFTYGVVDMIDGWSFSAIEFMIRWQAT
jgi:hypothetical protein